MGPYDTHLPRLGGDVSLSFLLLGVAVDFVAFELSPALIALVERTGHRGLLFVLVLVVGIVEAFMGDETWINEVVVSSSFGVRALWIG